MTTSSGRRSIWERSPFQVGFLGVLGGLLAMGLVGILGVLQQLLVLVVLSLFLALGINPLVEWLNHRRLPRALAVVLVAVLLLSLLVLGGFAVVPVIQDQGLRLFWNAPGYLAALRENPQIASLDAQFNIINRVTEEVKSGSWVNVLFGGIVGASRVVINTVFSVIMTIVLTLYFLSSLEQFKGFVYQLAPGSRRQRVRHLADQMFSRIGAYLTGLFIDVSLWAIGAVIMMYAIGLGQYALALAFMVLAFAFIPYVGWIASMAIISTIAFSISPTAGLVSLGYFLLYSQLDAYVIQPRIFSRSLNVPPALVVLGAISGGLLLGLVGALLAIPTVASLILLYREVVIPQLDAA